MRASSVLILVALSASAWSQAFGRFGYTSELDLPGWKVSKAGFQAKSLQADAFSFTKPSEVWSPTELSDKGVAIGLGQYVGAPSKIRADLFSPGFSLYFPLGIDLAVNSTGAPYLSWGEGSVAESVPTPSAPWILVSFRNAQPPVLLTFPETSCDLIVTGEAGAWRIKSPNGYKGWVKVVLPFGTEDAAANSASSLGTMAVRVKNDIDAWLTPTPKLLDTTVEADEDSVTAVWKFSGPGAVVPTGAVLAGLGGYPLKILSQTRRIEASTEEGPLTLCQGNELKILFPSKRIPTGRFVGVGKQEPLTTNTGEEYGRTVELALSTLSASRDSKLSSFGAKSLNSFLDTATTTAEPWTGQRLFHNEEGAGMDSAAANALLMQALSATKQVSSEANGLLTSIEWRIDWGTWQLWSKDRAVARRAAALAAITAALCPEESRRLEGAILQAGLSAERGLTVWQRLRGSYNQPMAKHLETMEGLRRALFLLESPLPTDPFGQALLSEVRFYGDTSILLLERDGKKFLTWFSLDGKPGQLKFASAYPIRFGASANLSGIEVQSSFGVTDVKYKPKDAGVCELELLTPDWAKPLPPAVAAPQFSETVR